MKMKSSKIFIVALMALIAALLSTSLAMAGQNCSVSAGIQSQNSLTVPELTNGSPTVVTLNGESSKQNATSFQWAQTSGPAVALSYQYDNNTSLPVKAQFTAPSVVSSGATLKFTLTVSGCTPSISSTAEIIVNVTNVDTNLPPVASATVSPSANVSEGTTVTLDGSPATDPDGDALTYVWTQLSGTPVALNGSGAIATFIAPNDAYPNGESLAFRLTVSDGNLSSSADKIVNITWVNDPPKALVICPDTVDEGHPVTLDGSRSSDPDNGMASFAWSQILGLPNADKDLSECTSSICTFTAPHLTSPINKMKFGLIVTDNGTPGLQDSAECDIVVNDITPPHIECTGPNQTIWHGDNVTVNCSASDVASGLADDTLATFTLTTSVTSGTETDSASSDSKEVCDSANNCDSAGSYTFKVDRKAPQLTSCDSPDGQWHSGDVTLKCYYTDGGSGPAAQDVTLTTHVDSGFETNNAAASANGANACDAVGNCAASPSDIVGSMIDRKAPTISANATKGDSTVYAAATWTNQSVIVNFACDDKGSGVKSCGPNVALSSDGETVSVAGTAVDKVGNTAGATFGPVKIDKTPPTASANASPAPNANSWNNTDVSVTFSGTDSLSGIASCTADVKLTSEGVGQSASGTCTDNAGNVSASASKVEINIDKTAPSITWNGGPDDGGTYYWGFVPAAPTCTATDALSGPNGCTVTGYSSAIGSQTLTATATDLAGNMATETRSYTVNAWTLKGFYQPVDMPIPTMVYNSVKNGSTVPLKFEIFAGSTELTDIGTVKSLTYIQTSCITGTATDDIEETVASSTGGTLLRYDTTGGQFIYNWKTSGITGKCYRVTVATWDGSSLVAYFKLK